MLALTFHGRRDLRLEDVPTPTPDADSVLVRVTDALLCQSIIDFNLEGHMADVSSPHPDTGIGLGFTLGQQFGGVIEAVGDNVDPSRVGETIGAAPGRGCGECPACSRGRFNQCPRLIYHGILGAHGGLASHVAMRADLAIPTPRPLGHLLEGLLVVHNMVRKARPWMAHADSIYILGAGPVGLSAAALLRDLYDRDPILHDVLPGRRERAAALGFRLATEAEQSSPHDIVFDCAGTNPETGGSALLDGLERVANSGVLVYVGTYLHDATFSPQANLFREIMIGSSFAYTQDDLDELVPRLGDLSLDLTPISERMPLEVAATTGLLRGEVDRDSFTAIVVDPE